MGRRVGENSGDYAPGQFPCWLILLEHDIHNCANFNIFAEFSIGHIRQVWPLHDKSLPHSNYDSMAEEWQAVGKVE